MEEKVLCDSWMTISQDPICGAEKEGGTYFRGLARTFMIVGNSGPTILRVIGMMFLLRRDGQASNKSATFLRCKGACANSAIERHRCCVHGKTSCVCFPCKCIIYLLDSHPYV
jgi:hypothetical protein